MEQRIGRYRILEEIASGSQGAVYRAFDPDSGQIVAVKVLHPSLTGNRDYLERFRREASLASSIDHPNVVRMFEVGQDGDRYFIALEFLPESLSRVIEGAGALPVERAAAFAVQIARGLAAAHALDIVHRDVKPQNVLIGPDGVAKLTDFGIARGELLPTMTATGAAMGTPHYMSPEQARGERADERSDVYSLGCVLYQMLAGEVPFKGNTPLAVIRQHIDERPRSVRRLRSEVPAAVERIVSRCMEKRPDRRYQTSRELVEALAETVPGAAPVRRRRRAQPPARAATPPSAPRPPAPERPRRGQGGRGVRRFIYGVLLLGVIAGLGVGGFLLAGLDTSVEVLEGTPTPTPAAVPTVAAAVPTVALTPTPIPTRSPTAMSALPDSARWITVGKTVEYTRPIATLLPNGKVLIVGSFNRAEFYDPISRTFTFTGFQFCHHSTGAATLLHDGTVLITGGTDSRCAQIYDVETGEFTRVADLKAEHSEHSSALLPDGRVLVAGGKKQIGDGFLTHAVAEIYDPTKGSFELTGELNTDRKEYVAMLLPSGQVLIAGGIKQITPQRPDGSGSLECLRSAELYDPSTETFRLIDSCRLKPVNQKLCC